MKFLINGKRVKAASTNNQILQTYFILLTVSHTEWCKDAVTTERYSIVWQVWCSESRCRQCSWDCRQCWSQAQSTEVSCVTKRHTVTATCCPPSARPRRCSSNVLVLVHLWARWRTVEGHDVSSSQFCFPLIENELQPLSSAAYQSDATSSDCMFRWHVDVLVMAEDMVVIRLLLQMSLPVSLPTLVVISHHYDNWRCVFFTVHVLQLL